MIRQRAYGENCHFTFIQNTKYYSVQIFICSLYRFYICTLSLVRCMANHSSIFFLHTRCLSNYTSFTTLKKYLKHVLVVTHIEKNKPQLAIPQIILFSCPILLIGSPDICEEKTHNNPKTHRLRPSCNFAFTRVYFSNLRISSRYPNKVNKETAYLSFYPWKRHAHPFTNKIKNY